ISGPLGLTGRHGTGSQDSPYKPKTYIIYRNRRCHVWFHGGPNILISNAAASASLHAACTVPALVGPGERASVGIVLRQIRSVRQKIPVIQGIGGPRSYCFVVSPQRVKAPHQICERSE